VRTFVALFRGINMRGQNKVAMADLRAIAQDLGLGGIKTLLQSGNLVFAAHGPGQSLETEFETALARRLKLTVPVLVRSFAAWSKLIAANPYDAAAYDPSRLAVMQLKHKPSPAALAALQKAVPGREVFATHGRSLFVYYPDGFDRAKFTTTLIDRTLKTIATARSWKTVVKIGQALETVRTTAL
jgi:uncharacterized protein (DUF1697 family)